MIITRIILIIILIISGNTMPAETKINDYFQYTENIIVYTNSKETHYQKSDNNFSLILESLDSLCDDAREMPAFGVSLHNETLIARNNGLWIELNFNKTFYHNDMPFSKLLIEVNSEFTGFNIIRFHDNKYDGRCFYLDLDKDMSELYKLILSI